jgi:hypothetical protein
MRLPPDDSRRVAAREAALDVEVHAKALIDALERAERARQEHRADDPRHLSRRGTRE